MQFSNCFAFQLSRYFMNNMEVLSIDLNKDTAFENRFRFDYKYPPVTFGFNIWQIVKE